MLFHRQARWLAIRTLAKTSLYQPIVQRSVVHLSPQGNHGTTPLIGLFSKLLTTKHNWRPIRQFAAKSRDGDELTDETSKTNLETTTTMSESAVNSHDGDHLTETSETKTTTKKSEHAANSHGGDPLTEISETNAETTTKNSAKETVWNTRYQELVQFQKKNGHCMVPQRYMENPSLGHWVDRQRRDYRKRKEGKVSPMADDRINLLEKIGFVWNVPDSTWMVRYEELKQFKATRGHCNVPSDDSANKELGTWVHKQRTEYRLQEKGKQSSAMTAERIALLEEIGFVWKPQESGWMERYEELKEFQQSNGHCNVPKQYPPNKKLGLWVYKQREAYRLRQAGKETKRMTDWRVEMLEKIGFSWDTRTRGSTWMKRYEELKKFKEMHGHCNVLQDDSVNKELSQWVETQRQEYQQRQEGKESSSLTGDRILMLKEIGFVWDAHGK